MTGRPGLPEVTPTEMRAAVIRIPAVFRHTPQYISDPLTDRLQWPVIVKLETLNPIGCFKGRGTWLAVQDLVDRELVGERGPVVVASAGNFGQGVAYVARALGVPAVVFAATTANAQKVTAMRRLGADVRLAGEDFDSARSAAAGHVQVHGGHLLIDGEDPWVAIGAGGMALELTDAIEQGDLPALTAMYIPVGNGALIAGIGSWLRQATPITRVIGVQAYRAQAMTLSWRAHQLITTPRADTIADGIAARVPVPEALEIMYRVVDDMVLVSEAQIEAATEELSSVLPVTVEPAAGAAWAAVLAGPPPSGPIGLIVTGGNTVR